MDIYEVQNTNKHLGIRYTGAEIRLIPPKIENTTDKMTFHWTVIFRLVQIFLLHLQYLEQLARGIVQ